ncbi:hypothetical protein BWQ96_08922 [Gracilariopsis chorda]|uniref:Uncharacterized protein n=1 Tax=Gracilariopsis chorda TaxID=448386 RepID=A0A2V3IH22_9FLOR|nr:hypothetical protein BWQ96_08922 [Gracilariopsis chorda]|eukprot:PXF41352.1 hypothetical protein BWQ96_08922 [Gracilariopsis chorda]
MSAFTFEKVPVLSNRATSYAVEAKIQARPEDSAHEYQAVLEDGFVVESGVRGWLDVFPGDIIWKIHGNILFRRNGVPAGRYDLLTTYQFLHDEVGVQIRDGYGSKPTEIEESTEGHSDLAEFVNFQ